MINTAQHKTLGPAVDSKVLLMLQSSSLRGFILLSLSKLSSYKYRLCHIGNTTHISVIYVPVPYIYTPFRTSYNYKQTVNKIMIIGYTLCGKGLYAHSPLCKTVLSLYHFAVTSPSAVANSISWYRMLVLIQSSGPIMILYNT